MINNSDDLTAEMNVISCRLGDLHLENANMNTRIGSEELEIINLKLLNRVAELEKEIFRLKRICNMNSMTIVSMIKYFGCKDNKNYNICGSCGEFIDLRNRKKRILMNNVCEDCWDDMVFVCSLCGSSIKVGSGRMFYTKDSKYTIHNSFHLCLEDCVCSACIFESFRYRCALCNFVGDSERCVFCERVMEELMRIK